LRRERNAAEVTALVTAVERRFGLRLHEGFHTVLADRASRLLEDHGVRSLREMVNKLHRGTDQDPLIVAMKQAATIGETYFFRAPKQLEALENLVVKQIAPAKRKAGQKTLRVWSSACATGEELYTLGIMFRAALPDFRIQLVGSDMNPAALSAARAATYGRRSLRGIEENVPKELKRHGDHWVVEPALRANVHLSECNLVLDDLPSTSQGLAAFDVIVCRNVLIYIDKDKIPLVMAKLTACANRRAVVLLAAAEYPAGRYLLGFSGMGNGLWYRQEAGVAEAPEKPTAARRPASARAAPSSPAAARSAVVEPALANSNQLRQLMVKAREAADSGDFAQALTYGEQALQVRDDAPEVYYLLGVVASATGDSSRARRELERALFFERSFIAAEFALGELLAREGNTEEANRRWQRAKKLLTKVDNEEPLPGWEIPASIAHRLVDTALKSGGI